MPELLKRKKGTRAKAKVRASVEQAGGDGKRCGACGHLRQETEVAPEWQCPRCKSAYNKVEAGYIAQKKTRRLMRRKEEKKREESKVEIGNKIDLSTMGAIAGILTLTQGMEKVCKSCMKACVPSAGNPLLMVIGGAILVASLAYLAWNYFKLH